MEVGAAPLCGVGWRGEFVCAVSYFSFRSNVAQRRGENSCAQGQTRSRKGPEPVRTVRKLSVSCTCCDAQVWYRFFQRRGVRFSGGARSKCVARNAKARSQNPHLCKKRRDAAPGKSKAGPPAIVSKILSATRPASSVTRPLNRSPRK